MSEWVSEWKIKEIKEININWISSSCSSSEDNVKDNDCVICKGMQYFNINEQVPAWKALISVLSVMFVC